MTQADKKTGVRKIVFYWWSGAPIPSLLSYNNTYSWGNSVETPLGIHKDDYSSASTYSTEPEFLNF